MKSFVVGILAICGTVTSAHALSASEVYHDCKEAKNDPLAVVSCASYMKGLMDGLDFAAMMNTTGARYCPPKNMDLTEFKAVVFKEMEAHPDKLHFPARDIAGIALYQAYQCGK